MRNLKKFLALVLAMMMAFSLLISANAAKDVTAREIYPDADTVTEQFKEAVDVLYGMGIMTGDRGSFYGDRSVMRSEMATVLYRLMTGDTGKLKNNLYAEQAANRFEDVDEGDWFAPYIGWCYDYGLMKGYNGYVRPGEYVTGYETLVMVLRAMGYGKNGEYVGREWSVNASSDGTVVGLLKDVDNSSYRNTLADYTRRDVVASIVFQAAQLPTVTYSPSLGYNQYVGVAVGTGGNVLNPSLGEKYFGLTCHYGIVVGNQASGEKGDYATKIGFSVNPTTSDNISGKFDDWATNKVLTKAEITDEIDANAYYYASDKATAQNVTLAFDWKTDLSLFNHKVKVWYDKRGFATETVGLSGVNGSGDASFGTNCKTYALYDEANAKSTGVKTAAVFDVDNSPKNKDLSEVFGAGVGTFFNYSFARMDATNQLASGGTYNTVGALSTKASPINRNNDKNDAGITEIDYPLYLGIDNTGNGRADVIISLNLTISKVVQDNNTQAPLTTGILTKNGTGTDYFDLMDQVDPSNTGDQAGSAADAYSNILNDNMMDSDPVALKDYVAAVTVTGTDKLYTTGGANTIFTGVNDATAAAGTATTDDTNNGSAGKTIGFNSTYYYKVMKLTEKVTKTVIKYNKENQEVFFSDGTSLKRSVYAPAVDGSFKEAAYVKAPTSNKEYTFYLDEKGEYLFWEINSSSSNFVYGTYIDWETKTASSTFDYPLVYVDAEGNALGDAPKLTQNITKVDDNSMDIAQYNTIQLPKRDKADGGNNSGFVKGHYIGYAMSDGTLTSVTDTDGKGTGFVQADTDNFGTYNSTTVIDANSVTIGSVPVANADSAGKLNVVGSGIYNANADHLFLTNSTKFVVVDGAGTDNQKSTVYNGLAEFLGEGNLSVTIDATTGLTATTAGDYLNEKDSVVNSTPYQMVYYSLSPETYDQVYDSSAKVIDTVFIPAPMIDRTPSVSGSLYFVGNSAANIIDADNNATQFTMYKDGVSDQYWIRGMSDLTKDATVDGKTPDADIVTELGDNVFYLLQKTGDTANDGRDIYALVAMEKNSADDKIIGQYYGRDGAGTLSSVTPAQTDVMANAALTKGYLATTQNKQAAFIGGRATQFMYNVGAAKVTNLNKNYTINTLDDLNGQSSLTSNQGVNVSCVLNESAYNTVSLIYVNYVR